MSKIKDMNRIKELLQEKGIKQMWTFRPDLNIDLCILPINPLVEAAKNMGNKLFFVPLDNSLIPNIELLKTLDVVENILMIGYPNYKD